jgi:hypothetical protein
MKYETQNTSSYKESDIKTILIYAKVIKKKFKVKIPSNNNV